jgi:hypothetical protein
MFAEAVTKPVERKCGLSCRCPSLLIRSGTWHPPGGLARRRIPANATNPTGIVLKIYPGWGEGYASKGRIPPVQGSPREGAESSPKQSFDGERETGFTEQPSVERGPPKTAYHDITMPSAIGKGECMSASAVSLSHALDLESLTRRWARCFQFPRWQSGAARRSTTNDVDVSGLRQTAPHIEPERAVVSEPRHDLPPFKVRRSAIDLLAQSSVIGLCGGELPAVRAQVFRFAVVSKEVAMTAIR